MTAITSDEAGLLDRPEATPDTTGRQSRLAAITRGLWHPLTAICAGQAALSLALAWSNTASADEAGTLWVGHLVIRNWLHGAQWPAATIRGTLSGSAVIYPPIGAVTDSLAGLAGARILSLLFMLGTTVLLYSVTSKLFGRGTAIIAAALWALGEPALRLTYATYDPLSVFLTALAAWLITLAAYPPVLADPLSTPAGQNRRRRILLAGLAAIALGLANATAYSAIVIDPFVVAFAFLVWWPVMRARAALGYGAAFAAGLVASFAAIMFGTGSWPGFATVFGRPTQDRESVTFVLNEIWGYSGFVMALALLGVLIAVRLETRQRAILVTVTGCAVLAAPAAQFHYGTAWSADLHMAYGYWFAIIAAAYGCAKVIGWPAGARTKLIAVGCAVALIYPAVGGFFAAWQRYHSWANAGSFVTAMRPLISQTSGPIYVPGHETAIAQYYLPAEGADWRRWSTRLDVSRFARGAYSVVALFYDAASLASGPQASAIAAGRVTQRMLRGLVSFNPGEPGVRRLTQALGRNPLYKLVSSGPYDITNITGTHSYGLFAIWERVGTP